MSKTKVLAGYNSWQVILFYLTFNFIDATTQMLYREVYRFRQKIITGDFDLILVKPVNSLFRSLFGGTDFLDFITLIPFIFFIGFSISRLPFFSIFGVFLYVLLIMNALIIATSFHIIVLALAVLTTEIDHAIMIYRDLSGMGKLPVEIYNEPLRSFITFIIPVGIMMTYPVKALTDMLDINLLFIAFFISATFLFFSIKFWNFSLRKYTSASS